MPPSEASLIAALGATPFLDLVTFRRDGAAVHTPVWVSTDGSALFVSTFGDSGKVKRIRRDPHVALAPCAGDGAVLIGQQYFEGAVRAVEGARFRPGIRAHRRKYGKHFAMMWPARWVFLLGGHPRVWLVIDIADDQPDPRVVVGPGPG